jgi:hypothetical protein
MRERECLTERVNMIKTEDGEDRREGRKVVGRAEWS